MIPTKQQNGKPRNVTLLVFEEVVLTSVSGTLDILAGTNECFDPGLPSPFRVEMASEKLRKMQLRMPVQFACHCTIDEIKKTDLIIVPSFHGSPDAILEKNRGLTEWLQKMYHNGTEVASLCRGSYFLAEAGLLEAKSATSHWRSIDDMKQRYPNVTMLPDVIITDQDRVYTSGGAFSSIHLVLYLIEKFCGRELAIHVSKIFSIDMDRVSQAHFAVFRGQREHDDKEILKAQIFIEENFQEPISVEQIAAQTHMSKRNFIRRFKKATQNTPLEYIQRVKVEAAKKALEKRPDNIGSLMYEVGYNDAKSFRSVFKRVTGLTPQDYRNKYSRN